MRLHSSAIVVPTSMARKHSAGESRKNPTTAGTSLSENECFSRRKWTSTTLSSVMTNAAAIAHHGRKTPGGTGGTGWWRR